MVDVYKKKRMHNTMPKKMHKKTLENVPKNARKTIQKRSWHTTRYHPLQQCIAHEAINFIAEAVWHCLKAGMSFDFHKLGGVVEETASRG